MDDYSVKHPKVWNIALCCGRCNTSRGPYSDPKGLAEWFDSAYCRKNNISRQTVAPLSVKNRLDEVKFRCFPVKRTLRRQECSPRRSGGERTVYLSCSTKRFPPSCCFASRRQRSEEHTSELQSRLHLVCRLLLEKKK